mmetsp:Transcript_64997/g.121046  ORF Transcript_64997/g.121046 Transcript_64997/m.121046 type:complete len:108 (-) Transcript_64997:135-458(-)
MLALFTNALQHTIYVCWHREPDVVSSFPGRFAPAYVVAMATVLAMAHPTFLVLKVAHKVTGLATDFQMEMLHYATLSGYVLLLLGLAMIMDVHKKLGSLYTSTSFEP